MSSDKSPSEIPLFSSKKATKLSVRKNFRALFLILGPLMLLGFLFSWALGRLVGQSSEPREVLAVVFQGPGQARRAAMGEWAYQLQTLDSDDPKNLLNPWFPKSLNINRLLKLLDETASESDSLFKSSVVLVLGYSLEDKLEVSNKLLEILIRDAQGDSQLCIQLMISLARLKQDLLVETALLQSLQNHPEARVRKTLAFVLGVGLWKTNNASRLTLLSLLNDSVDDVRWNAAFALAAESPADSLAVFQEIIKRAEDLLGRSSDELLTAELLTAFAATFKWAYKLNDPNLIERVKSMADGHSNLKIRQAALAAKPSIE